MAKGRFALVVMTVLAVALSGLSLLLARMRPSGQVAAEPATAPLTATVELRPLRGTITLRGTVTVPPVIEVWAEPAMHDRQVIVSAPPPRPGSRLGEGARVAEVSGRPVFLLRGSVPMYRNLRRGSRGKDVAQLQAALARLGFGSPDARGRFGAGTEAAVRRFYRVRGYQPRMERVPQARAVTPAPRGRAGGGPGARPAGDGGAAKRQAPPPPAERLVVPWSEVVFVRRVPATVVTAPVGVGQRPDGPVLTLATGTTTVEVPLDGLERRMVRRGARARVELEPGGRRLDATVAAVKGGRALLALRRPPPADAAGAAVRVVVDAVATAGAVLTVPLAAIWSRADGTTYLTVLNGSTVREVMVQPGLSSGDMVEVTPIGGALTPGDLVVTGVTGGGAGGGAGRAGARERS